MAETLPALPTTPEELGAGYAQAYGGVTEAAYQGAIDQTRSLLGFAQDVTAGNYARYPTASYYALSATRDATRNINQSLSGQFYSNLDYVMPGWRDVTVNPATTASRRTGTASQALTANVTNQALNSLNQQIGSNQAYLSSMLRGELPSDMKEMLSTAAAESSMARGIFGQAASGNLTKELARASLDRISTGLQQSQVLMNQGPAAYADLMSGYGAAYDTYQRSSEIVGLYKAPQIDSSRVYTTNLANITGVAMSSPGTAMTALGQAQSANLAAAASAWGSFAEYNNDIWASDINNQQTRRLQQQMDSNNRKQQQRSERTGALSGAATGAMAGYQYTGTAYGAAAGAVIGGVMGYAASQ